MVPRFIFGWHGYIVTSIICIIINNLSFDMPGEKHYFKKTIRMYIIKAGNYYCSLCCFLGMGLVWKYEDKNISYEKYLGPDWKCKHQPSTRISNHVGYTDICVH